MIQTLDFICMAYRNAELKNKIVKFMECDENAVFDIGVHRLWFNARTQYVVITCNDDTYIFKAKMIPMRISYQSLNAMLNQEWKDNYDMDYLFNVVKKCYVFDNIRNL